MTFITLDEAKKQAAEIKKIPTEFLNDAKNQIIESIANGGTFIIVSKPDSMPQLQWIGFQSILKSNGWDFVSQSCQRDGQWVNIKLPA